MVEAQHLCREGDARRPVKMVHCGVRSLCTWPSLEWSDRAHLGHYVCVCARAHVCVCVCVLQRVVLFTS